jgi:hypothetical protein
MRSGTEAPRLGRLPAWIAGAGPDRFVNVTSGLAKCRKVYVSPSV